MAKNVIHNKLGRDMNELHDLVMTKCIVNLDSYASIDLMVNSILSHCPRNKGKIQCQELTDVGWV